MKNTSKRSYELRGFDPIDGHHVFTIFCEYRRPKHSRWLLMRMSNFSKDAFSSAEEAQRWADKLRKDRGTNWVKVDVLVTLDRHKREIDRVDIK